MRKLFLLGVLMLVLAAPAHAETIKASVNGLVCSFCATGIKKTFKAQDAVQDVDVNMDEKLVTINTKPDANLDDATVTQLITDAGYTVTNISRNK